jgi:hypothetical protein
MAGPVFHQNVIAVIWDFDKTLIPGYMQTPLFERYGVDEGQFWAEVNALPDFQREQGLELVSPDTVYLNHILTYVREGTFGDLNNAILRELGGELAFYDGIPDLLPRLKQIENNPRYRRAEISVEHYIVSTGLRQMILGSPIAEHVTDVWACEFVEHLAPPGFLAGHQVELTDEPVLQDIGYVIDNTTKTRGVFEINKGVNKFPDQITVNDRMVPENRRVPFKNMIYVADGPSDIPVFSILNQYGGETFAVYKPEDAREFRRVRELVAQDRVNGGGPADYSEGTHTALWISDAAERIAERIVAEHAAQLRESVGKPPEHIVPPPADESPAGPPEAPMPREIDGSIEES